MRDWAPISKGLLAHLREVSASPFESLLFRDAFLLTFFGSFQISELVGKGSRKGILAEDVELGIQRCRF